jgi:hypothetical protein
MMNGGPISWKSHLQSLVRLSSTEAEYYAASEAAIEASKMVLIQLNQDFSTT